jgi:glycosyltransferase involved in cell wall biosynthesis
MLEAMTSARSVVATDVAGELAGAGAIVPVGANHLLAAALAERLTAGALADHEGAEARRRVERDFDLANVAAHVGQVYDELPASRRPSSLETAG